MKNKRLLLIFLVVVIVLGGLFTVFHHARQNQTKNTAQNHIVVITNMQDFATWLDSSSIPTVQKSLYTQIQRYARSPQSVYMGTIRRDTFKTAYSQYLGESTAVNVPTVHYIVDIPSIKQSYAVDTSGGRGYPYNITYVTCPDKSQLKYGDFGCTNEE
jgi:hypothetical protein